MSYVALQYFCCNALNSVYIEGTRSLPGSGAQVILRIGAWTGREQRSARSRKCPHQRMTTMSDETAMENKPKLFAVNTDQMFQMPKFEIPKFDVPNMEVPP